MLGGLLWLNLFTQGEGLQLCMRELSEQGVNQEVSKEGHKNMRLQERELGKVYQGTDMVETYPEELPSAQQCLLMAVFGICQWILNVRKKSAKLENFVATESSYRKVLVLYNIEVDKNLGPAIG